MGNWGWVVVAWFGIVVVVLVVMQSHCHTVVTGSNAITAIGVGIEVGVGG